MTRKKIGLFGGTFNPPHNGHVNVARVVQRALALDEVWFMPTYIAPHKSSDETIDAAKRLRMVELAIEGEPTFRAFDYELKKRGTSYTYDTMKQLVVDCPNDYYFIIGGDMIDTLHTWYAIDQLVELVTFVGVDRPGYASKTAYPIERVTVPPFDVSSSLIRARIREGQSIDGLVPPAVKRYMEEERLYGMAPNEK